MTPPRLEQRTPLPDPGRPLDPLQHVDPFEVTLDRHPEERAFAPSPSRPPPSNRTRFLLLAGLFSFATGFGFAAIALSVVTG